MLMNDLHLHIIAFNKSYGLNLLVINNLIFRCGAKDKKENKN